ncbi:hypothetical protein PR048_002917 [Dryococelus australis]|uniref:Uncharacterized protein n=1 Tax=Dryococelus australis TaxID=614101 RepID=A0ABQ9ILJ0_9NEOP|nr:hypothetical protein PR048_002917 [Dryococelus australis]
MKGLSGVPEVLGLSWVKTRYAAHSNVQNKSWVPRESALLAPASAVLIKGWTLGGSEKRIYKCTIIMQELGFDLTAIQVRKLPYNLAGSTLLTKLSKGVHAICKICTYKRTPDELNQPSVVVSLYDRGLNVSEELTLHFCGKYLENLLKLTRLLPADAGTWPYWRTPRSAREAVRQPLAARPGTTKNRILGCMNKRLPCSLPLRVMRAGWRGDDVDMGTRIAGETAAGDGYAESCGKLGDELAAPSGTPLSLVNLLLVGEEEGSGDVDLVTGCCGGECMMCSWLEGSTSCLAAPGTTALEATLLPMSAYLAPLHSVVVAQGMNMDTARKIERVAPDDQLETKLLSEGNRFLVLQLLLLLTSAPEQASLMGMEP